jgi:hypothetical protein
MKVHATTTDFAYRAIAPPGSESAPSDEESELLEILTEWIQLHHRHGGDFSMDAIASAGDAGRKALRTGYSLQEAFEAARDAYFESLGHLAAREARD